MATATTILRHEHDAILRMLEVTEAVAGELEHDQPVATDTLTGLLEFFRLFADRCHHGKEEDLLFPLLEKKGLPRAGGPTGVMRMEHEEGRALIRQMTEAAQSYGADPATPGGTRAAAGRSWAHAARSYTALLRQHIEKENNILFRIAENMLTPAEQSELAAQFETVETEKMGVGTHERLHALMETLSARVLTPHS